MFSLAVEDGIRVDHPFSCVTKRERKRAKAEKRAKRIAKSQALTLEERDRVLLVARWLLDFVMYVFYCLLAGTGLRPAEARGLAWENMNLDGRGTGGVPMIHVRGTFKKSGRFGVTKNKMERDVELDPTLVALLKALRALRRPAPADLVFCHADGTPLKENETKKQWGLIFGLANIDRWLSLYCFRHTYASILLSEGSDGDDRDNLLFVSSQLGHATTDMTEQVYGCWIHKKSRGALRRLRLDRIVVVPPVALPPSHNSGM